MIWDVIKELLIKFAQAIPNFIGAILIILIGWVIARLLAKTIKKLLASIGLDKLAQKLNAIEIVHKSKLTIVPSVVISKIIYYILLLIFTVAATETLGMPAVSELMSDILNYVPNLISAIIVFILGLFIADFIKDLIDTACQSLAIPSGKFIANFIFYFLLITIAMSALAQAKIDTDFITANLSIILAGIVAAFAIGYGFASRDLVANFIASFYSKKKINIGDIIGIEGVKGIIIAIDNNSFTLKAEDKLVIIPLSKLTSEKIEIYSKGENLDI